MAAVTLEPAGGTPPASRRALGDTATLTAILRQPRTALGIQGAVIFAIPLQWYALQIVFLEEAGQIFPVYVPWLEACVIALAAVAIATLAGVGPALFAVRERIPEAIAYE